MKKAKITKSNYIILSFLCTITFLIAFNVTWSNPKALNEVDKNGNICWLCGKDDLQNYKEWQFIQKIKDIKFVFGNQINEPALMSTVMHKYSAIKTINDQYDENYDSNEFKNAYKALNNLTGTSMKAEKNAQIDLLTAATIVMLDSSGFGKSYDEKKYQEALAKSQLVGNADAGGYFANAAFCTFGAFGDTIVTPFQFLFAPFVGDNVADVAINKATRYTNMISICENGYIGGLYDDVKKTDNTEQKQAKKDQIAKEIIQNVDAYKEIFGLKEDKCLYNSSSYTGEAVNWRQSGSPWSSMTMGGGETVAASGCTSTSMAYLIQKSGTKLTSDNFDPGVFVQSAKYTSSMLIWNSWNEIAPNFVMENQNLTLNGADSAVIFSNLVNEPTAGGNQRFIVIEVPGHWVAFDHVENGVVYVMDPAAPAGTGLIPLDDVTSQRGGVLHYNTFYASDVPFGSSGSSSSGGTASNGSSSSYDECSTAGDSEAFAGFIASVEGSAECNYRGQGDGSGYESYNLGDGAGFTTAFGITENYQKDVATEVGYGDFVSDMHGGCTNKAFVDKMFPSVLKKYSDYVDANSEGLNLSGSERDAMTSLTYGGFNLFDIMADKIRGNGKESFEVFDCFKSNGCSWFASGFDDGLVRRRMAEYELFRAGNYNANRPTENYGYFSNINNEAKMKEYMDTHWPTSR